MQCNCKIYKVCCFKVSDDVNLCMYIYIIEHIQLYHNSNCREAHVEMRSKLGLAGSVTATI